MNKEIENIIKKNLPEEKEEIIIKDCENCGGEGYGKAWYGKGKPNDPYGYGDAYYPTGSVVFCKECSPEFELGKIWDGEKIWKRTSDSENHTELRLNNIKKKVKENVGFNQALSQINTSRIADEVLKVVVEKIKEINEYHTDIGGRNVVFTDDYIRKEDIINYLSHNKENKNNENT